MEEKRVYLTIERGLGVIALNNPPQNLLSKEVILGIDRIQEEVAGRDELRALILTGSGDCFSYGADIREIAEVKDAARTRELCLQGQQVFHRFWTSDIPTIAALNGKCLGGGLEIALACHFRVADEGIRLGFPEIRLGLMPGWGGTQRMARLVGPSIALDYVLTGRMMDPERALALGIVNEVCPRGEALACAKAFARRIAGKSRQAVKEALEAITWGIERGLLEALEREAEGFGRLRETPEAQEGLDAFFEGRRPRY